MWLNAQLDRVIIANKQIPVHGIIGMVADLFHYYDIVTIYASVFRCKRVKDGTWNDKYEEYAANVMEM